MNHQERLVLVVILVFLLVLIGSLLYFLDEKSGELKTVNQTVASGTASIVCKEPVFTFGSVKRNTTLKHIFYVQNQGTAPLVISSVESSCNSCLQILPIQRQIPPGGEIPVPIILKANWYFGVLDKTVILFTNDPKHHIFLLKVMGKIDCPISLEPENIHLKEVDFKTPVKFSIQLMSQEQALDDLFVDVQSKFSFVSYKIEKTTNQKWLLNFTCTPPFEPKFYEETMVLVTNTKNFEMIPISFVMEIKGEIRPTVSSLTFNYQSKDNFDSEFRVFPDLVTDYTITKVVSPDPNSKVIIKEYQKNHYSIKISNLKPSRELHGQFLEVYTNLKETPIIKIPFVSVEE